VPALDISTLRAQLTSGKLASVYVFAGEDIKLVDRMVDGVEATIDPADRPFAVERLYAGEAGGSPIDIAAAARVYPMLGDRRVVFVMRAERLLKPKRASKAAETEEADDKDPAEESGWDFEPLEDYLGSPSPSTVLVFVATEIDRGRRFTKRLMEKAQVVVFGGLGDPTAAGRRDGRADATTLVQDEMARAGRSIDPAALKELVVRGGMDITKLRSDLERLLLDTEGQKAISVEDVREIASVDVSVEDDWALVTAIGDGDCARALREAARRLDRGDSVHAVVGQLRWWVSVRLAEAAPARVGAATEALLRTDLALKSSGGDERVLIERLVVELSGAPMPRRGWR
jgi:DNA polymerase III delta subunit